MTIVRSNQWPVNDIDVTGLLVGVHGFLLYTANIFTDLNILLSS